MMNILFSPQTYRQRREALKSKINNGLILFLGHTESPMNYPANAYSFRQNSSFLYFFGLNLPDLAAVIDTETGEEILFGDDFTIDDIIWMGDQPKTADLAEKVDVKKTFPLNKLSDFLKQNASRTIHFLPPYRAESVLTLSRLLQISTEEVKSKVSVELIKAVVALRSVKSEEEILEMEKACTVGAVMQNTVMHLCAEGQTEQFLYSVMTGIASQYGNGTSFPVILSQHGEILHNHDHSGVLKNENLLLVDSGCQIHSFYCSDHTRTLPIGGKFTQKQKEIYEIVLAAKEQSIAQIQPGRFYKDIHLNAAKIIAEGLKNLGLMKGCMDEAVAAGAHALFFPHGLGHQVGLDVHDMEDLGENYVGYDEQVQRATVFGLSGLRMARQLKPGFTISVEPGIYFIPKLIEQWRAEHKFQDFINYDRLESYLDFGGIRIEDCVAVTENGARVLGTHLAETVAELESAIGQPL